MGISEILSDVVMREMRSHAESAERLVTGIRAENSPAAMSDQLLLSRRPLRSDMNGGRTKASRTNNATSSGIFGSILAPVDNSRKRKRTDREEKGDDEEGREKSRKTL